MTDREVPLPSEGCGHDVLNNTDLWCKEGHIVYECYRCRKQACALEWSRSRVVAT